MSIYEQSMNFDNKYQSFSKFECILIDLGKTTETSRGRLKFWHKLSYTAVTKSGDLPLVFTTRIKRRVAFERHGPRLQRDVWRNKPLAASLARLDQL